jgi:hypothetical protein
LCERRFCKKIFGAGRDSAVGLSRESYTTERTGSPVVPPTRSSPAGGRKFDKAKSTGRIDALVALAMALSLAPVQPSYPSRRRDT